MQRDKSLRREKEKKETFMFFCLNGNPASARRSLDDNVKGWRQTGERDVQMTITAASGTRTERFAWQSFNLSKWERSP